jgi:pyroglutamyl-peptidase
VKPRGSLEYFAKSQQETDVRVSEDAGRYLCDFIYFSSLAYLTKKKEEKRVVFLHVPVETEERHIAMGIEATIELIRAIVQSGQLKNITAPIPNHHLSQVPFQA